MTFTTLTFLLFLVTVFSLYWALRSLKAQNRLLLIAGYFFYGWWDWRFCGLMLLSSVADYLFAIGLVKYSTPRTRKLIVAGSCVFNLTLLGFFKYFNFFADSLHGVMEALGWKADFVTLHVVLPVGISFYTFQSMSYIIDVYRGQVQPARRLMDYLTYVCLFPQLVAGPIERGSHLLPQVLNPRRFDYPAAVDGLRLMLWGFFKKMALADNLAQYADQAYANPHAFSGPHLLFASLAFAFQIYCDFSGYSDIAIGTAKLFGFSLIRNFAYPYFSQSVPEFWRRWHISLSTWFRDYLFFPLGGSRVSARRHMFNLVTTFAVSGLWHGAAWTYIFWGVLNGVAMFPVVMHRSKQRVTPTDIPGGESFLPRLTVVMKITATFSFILITWIFFRASSLTDACLVLDRIFVHPVWHTAVQFSGNLPTKTIVILVFAFVWIEWVQRRHLHALVLDHWPRPLRWTVYTTMIWLTLWLAPLQSGAFIYFQF